MTRIIDLIPTDVRNRWDGFDCKIEAPLTLGNESTLVAALLNKDGSKIVVAFDLHEGVEVKKKSKHDKAVELLKRWDSVKIPSTVWTTPAEDFTLPEDTQSFLNDIENNKIEIVKTYKVAATWEVCGEIEMKAINLQDACHKVEADNDIPLPESDYVDGSFRIDREMSKYLNEGLSNGQPNME